MFYSNVTGLLVYSPLDVGIRSETAICITGHREKSIVPYKGDPAMQKITCTAVKLLLGRYIEIFMDNGYTTLISGLAEGIDLWAADYALSRKRLAKESWVIGVMPYLRHAKGFSMKNTEFLSHVERFADLLLTTCDNQNMVYGKAGKYNTDPNIYRNRNRYMVDNSSAVIAFYNEDSSRSGTGQTVRYAISQDKPVISFNINDVYKILDDAGTEKMAIAEAVNKIKFDVPKP